MPDEPHAQQPRNAQADTLLYAANESMVAEVATGALLLSPFVSDRTAGAALTGFSPWAAILLVALAGLRLVQAFVLSQLLGADDQFLWLVPLRDLLSFGIFLAAVCGDRVEWRGNRFKIVRGGAIAAVS